MTTKISEFGQLNDKIRRNGDWGPDRPNPLMVTPGVQDLGPDAIGHLYLAAMRYPEDKFEGNDPRGDRDMLFLEYDGENVIIQIDPGKTPDTRVFTMMLSSER